jgi:hypothetical protein
LLLRKIITLIDLKRTRWEGACGTHGEASRKDAAWKTYARLMDNIKINIDGIG